QVMQPTYGDPNNPANGQPLPSNTNSNPAPTTTSGAQIDQFYKQYLGRNPGQYANGTVDPTDQNAYAAWEGMSPDQAQAGIKNSVEAQNYASTGQAANAPGADQSKALYNLLMQRATQTLTPDANDPVIKAQTDAYAADTTRQARDLMSANAE